MDIKEFVSLRAPSKSRGKLASFEKEIIELNSRGYSVVDIQEWLKSTGLDVSTRAIYKRLKPTKTQGPSANSTPIKEAKGENKNADVQISTVENQNPVLNKFKSGSTRGEREAFASQFISETPLSPGVRRLISEKEKS